MPSLRAQEAIRLRVEEKLTYQEIGDRMGITRQGAHLLINPDRHRTYQRERYKQQKEDIAANIFQAATGGPDFTIKEWKRSK